MRFSALLFFRYGLAVLAVMGAVATARAELIVNGGFEDGLNGWTFTGDGVNAIVSLSSDTPTGVGSSADLDVNVVVGLPWLMQDVPVVAGSELTFSTWIREVEPASPTDAWIAAQVWMLPSSDSGAILASAALFFSGAKWEQQSTQITVPPTATIARVLFTPQNTSFGVGNGQYRIDNVSLVVPEPSSLGLLGVMSWIGIGTGLPVRRRRQVREL